MSRHALSLLPGAARLAALHVAVLLLAAPAAAQDPSVDPGAAAEPETPKVRFAIAGVTIHPLDRPAERDVTVVVEDGIITSVGSLMAPPEGVPVIELPGKELYPGLIHPFSTLGLVEIGSVRGTRDVNEVGDNNADLRAEVAFNADSLRLAPSVRGGVLYAHIHQRGGLFTGTTALMRLAGWNWRDMTLDAPVGMVLDFPQVAGGGDDDEDGEASSRAMAALDETLATARAYARAKAAGSPGLDVDPKLEALRPVVEDEMRLFVLAAGGRDHLEAALDWIEEQDFSEVVLVANYEARYLAERIAELDLPLILTDVLALPSRDWEPYDAAYGAPAALHEAGVTFAIAGEGGAFASSNTRNLPFHAAMAAAFGLPKAVALRSITQTPADLLGLGDRLGSITPGKEASFFIASGDALQVVTQIERAWIAGREVDLTDDHQYRLYQKYWNRPRPGEAPEPVESELVDTGER